MWKLIPEVIITIADLSESSYERSESLRAIDNILAELHQK